MGKKLFMNFDDAVAAHSEWKRKLYSYVQQPDHSLRADDVAADDRCVMGQWLKGEAQKYSAFPEFAKLKAEHTRVHKAAADIVNRVNSGQDVSADLAIGGGSEFGRASSAVVLAIVSLKKKHEGNS
jgi:hypothetical protein